MSTVLVKNDKVRAGSSSKLGTDWLLPLSKCVLDTLFYTLCFLSRSLSLFLVRAFRFHRATYCTSVSASTVVGIKSV